MNHKRRKNEKTTNGLRMPRRRERSPPSLDRQLTSYLIRKGLKMNRRTECQKRLENEQKKARKGLKMNRRPEKAWKWTEGQKRLENEQKARKWTEDHKRSGHAKKMRKTSIIPGHQLTSYHVRKGLKMKIRPEKAWKWTEDHKRPKNEQKTTRGLKMNRRPQKAWRWTEDYKWLVHAKKMRKISITRPPTDLLILPEKAWKWK